MQGSGGGLVFELYPSKNEVKYACVGKPVQGWWTVSTEMDTSLSNPLAPLVPFQIQVWSTPPLIGKLSKDSWSIRNTAASKTFTYTPTKTGDEHLIFNAWILDSSPAPLARSIDLTVVNCRYRVDIHAEIQNIQGSINSNIFYDGTGFMDLVPNKDSTWTIKGRGTTQLEEYVDGTEGDVTCVTTSPGTGSGSFYIEGEGDPSTSLNPVFRFTDIQTSVGQSCNDRGKGKTMPSSIPTTGWLPNSAGQGVLYDLQFSPKGESKDLPFSRLTILAGSRVAATER